MTMRCLLLLAWFAISAAAQPASDLLQSGIYAQETLGDVDGAIRIYRQILNSGAAMRLYAAQAQYRLGACLLRKGDIAGATQAFQAVIKGYPDQLELVARARESTPLGGGLLPAPWSETEVSEYRWTIPGVDDGWSISRIGASAKGKRTLGIRMNFYGPQLNSTMVDVDRETMLPGPASYRGPNKQNARTADGWGVHLMPAPDQRSGQPVYSLAELLYLLRRMPLDDPGWTATIRLMSPGDHPGRLSAVRATVAGSERVAVPAGTFECHKVRLTADADMPPPRSSSVGLDWPRPPDGETLWFATEGAHPLVKIECGVARGELTSLRTGESKGTSSYRDIKAGYSFTLPPGWVYHGRTAIASIGSSVDLIDPESQAVVVISGRQQRTPPDRIAAELQKGADDRRKQNADTPPRTETFGRVGGQQSLTWITTRDSRVSYLTWVQTEATRASITFQADAAEFDGILKRLQPILDSFRMP